MDEFIFIVKLSIIVLGLKEKYVNVFRRDFKIYEVIDFK